MSEERTTNSESIDWVILNLIDLGFGGSDQTIVSRADMPDDDVRGNFRRLFEAGFIEEG